METIENRFAGGTLRPAAVVTFWLPLAATWLMMAAEGPYLTAIVARMQDPARALAGFGVALSLALLIESPIMMLLSASAALVRDRTSYLALRQFSVLMNGVVTAAMGLLAVPRVFAFVARDLMALPADVARLAHVATTILILWPAAIGVRRFYQGILVRHGLTRRVAYGTIVRLVSMSIAAGLLAWSRPPGMSGAAIGATALLCGVVGEAAASRWMVHRLIGRLLQNDRADDTTLVGTRRIGRFYFPLALTSVLAMATGPLVTFGLARGRLPLDSLAVWPVILALLFVFRSGGIAFQEVGIALAGTDSARERVVTRTAAGIGALASAGLAMLAFTPLAELWIGRVSGLSDRLTSFSLLPLRLLALYPLLEYLLSVQRVRWIVHRRTGAVTVATAIETVGLAGALFLAVGPFAMTGAVAGAVAMLFGRISANLYLFARARSGVPLGASV